MQGGDITNRCEKERKILIRFYMCAEKYSELTLTEQSIPKFKLASHRPQFRP